MRDLVKTNYVAKEEAKGYILRVDLEIMLWGGLKDNKTDNGKRKKKTETVGTERKDAPKHCLSFFRFCLTLCGCAVYWHQHCCYIMPPHTNKPDRMHYFPQERQIACSSGSKGNVQERKLQGSAVVWVSSTRNYFNQTMNQILSLHSNSCRIVLIQKCRTSSVCH